MSIGRKTLNIKEVVKRCGGEEMLSKDLGITPPAIWQWYTAGGIPAWQARNVSVLSGFDIFALPVRWAALPANRSPRSPQSGREDAIAA
jgi:hypothetical protein